MSSRTVMRAAVFHEYGPPDVLRTEEVPYPTPDSREAVVRVEAAAVNGVDLAIREGRFKPNSSFPHILGHDFVGEVIEVGGKVPRGVQVGQRVISWSVIRTCGSCEECLTGNPNRCPIDYRYLGAHFPGAYAEYVKVPAANLVQVPKEISAEGAAAFPVSFGTAWHMLVSRAQVGPGQTVLVHSASSGVSAAAIQIANLMGAYVITTTSADWKAQRAQDIGAHLVINYNTDDFVEVVKMQTRKRGVDVVLDHVGGKTLEQSIHCLSRGGRLVTCGGSSGYDVHLNLAHIFHKEISVIGSNSYTLAELRRMIPLLERGELRPVVDRVFPLDAAAEAHRYLELRRHFGKVLLTVGHT